MTQDSLRKERAGPATEEFQSMERRFRRPPLPGLRALLVSPIGKKRSEGDREEEAQADAQINELVQSEQRQEWHNQKSGQAEIRCESEGWFAPSGTPRKTGFSLSAAHGVELSGG